MTNGDQTDPSFLYRIHVFTRYLHEYLLSELEEMECEMPTSSRGRTGSRDKRTSAAVCDDSVSSSYTDIEEEEEEEEESETDTVLDNIVKSQKGNSIKPPPAITTTHHVSQRKSVLSL